MSEKTPDVAPAVLRNNASLFAALGDATRLDLLMHMTTGEPRSITRLSRHSALSRQAITKHLRVLEDAGLVRSKSRGREKLFGLEPGALDETRHALDMISKQWDESLARLKAWVEDPG